MAAKESLRGEIKKKGIAKNNKASGAGPQNDTRNSQRTEGESLNAGEGCDGVARTISDVAQLKCRQERFLARCRGGTVCVLDFR